jgi:hypothetical protein
MKTLSFIVTQLSHLVNFCGVKKVKGSYRSFSAACGVKDFCFTNIELIVSNCQNCSFISTWIHFR